jgi:hypothetical protein
MRIVLRVMMALALAAAFAPALATTPAESAFARLQTLAGRWEGTFPDGRTHQVEYRTTAGGTVLVETWALAPGRESMTLYHLDGTRLLATHYCPQGTQPRLALLPASTAEALEFGFVDGTGLQDPERSHQRSMWLRFTADGFERGETYVGNADTGAEVDAPPRGEAIVYRRIAAPPATD